VVELEEFPGRVGVGERGFEEVDLYGRVAVAGGSVGVFVDGGALGGVLVSVGSFLECGRGTFW
jgi:hypothetical protein